MKERTERNYVDYGCGFPVVIDKVRIREERYGDVARINYDVLQFKVLEALVGKATPLTGNQVKFIRQHFRLTLQSFAVLLKVSHPAVSKWENREDDPTKMTPATEILLRLFVQKKIGARSSDFMRSFQWLMDTIGNEGRNVETSAPISVSGVSLGGDKGRSRRVVG